MGEDDISDYYMEGDRLVFTRQYHLRRGSCCGSGCRHCPYQPRWSKGEQKVFLKKESLSDLRQASLSPGLPALSTSEDDPEGDPENDMDTGLA